MAGWPRIAEFQKIALHGSGLCLFYLAFSAVPGFAFRSFNLSFFLLSTEPLPYGIWTNADTTNIYTFCSVLFCSAGVAVAMVWAMVWVTTVWR